MDQSLKEPQGWSAVGRHDTLGLAFSQDGKRLAVTLSHLFHVSGSRGPDNTHVLIFDVQKPAENFKQFDLAGTCGVDVSWNSNGSALLVCGKLLRLTDGAVCVAGSFPPGLEGLARFGGNRAVWFDSEHTILPSGAILDLNCKEVNTFAIPAGWYIASLGFDKNWIVISKTHNSLCDATILDRAASRPLPGWPRPDWQCGTNLMFAEGAEALCNSVDPVDKQELRCWSVDGAKEISVPKKFEHYRLDQTATSSPRVIADRWGWDFFAIESPAYPKQRVVFDLRSGKEIASWKPRMQQSSSAWNEDRPYHCALSENGEYVAESGDGLLEVYRLIR
jgi:hypothetical protein